jgi:hypothetical protein
MKHGWVHEVEAPLKLCSRQPPLALKGIFEQQAFIVDVPSFG